MIPDFDDAVHLVWDLSKQKITIGGALVLRQEGEMIACWLDISKIILHIKAKENDRDSLARIVQTIFSTSIYNIQIDYENECANAWPTATLRSEPNFSYFDFSRVVYLHSMTSLKPCLQWSNSQQALSKRFRGHFQGRLFCVHLKSVAPFSKSESNADGKEWANFFTHHAEVGKCDFLLIGDDPLPEGLTLRPGLMRADELGIDLATQLALINLSDGFIGMASGLCTAANFSNTPHVIFKHPSHHPEEMIRELGASNAFKFAADCQQLWRCEATAPILDKAFNLIIS